MFGFDFSQPHTDIITLPFSVINFSHGVILPFSGQKVPQYGVFQYPFKVTLEESPLKALPSFTGPLSIP